MDVEICINSDSSENIRRNIRNACSGGAARIELCSDMHLDGLTPSPEHITIAREAFENRPGLMVMIRLRDGDFYFSRQENAAMVRQIETAAKHGADGVVVGVLRKKDACVDRAAMRLLLAAARDYGLGVTFHRAIDATPEPLRAMDDLAELGVDRVLSSGVAWGGAGGAIQGLEMLNKIASRARKVEIVIGGGVTPANAQHIVSGIAHERHVISLHAYSSVLENGVVNIDKVRALVAGAQAPGC